MDLAEYLTEIGDCQGAITEYKRFICFNPNSPLLSDAYLWMGRLFAREDLWTEAVEATDSSMEICHEDSLVDEGRISQAVIMLASKDYSRAELQLLRVAHFSDYASLRAQASFFLGLCYLHLSRWDESRAAFRRYFAHADPGKDAGLDSLLKRSHQLTYKSARTAKWLSTLAPGSGQLYVGDYRNGITAIVVNLLTVSMLWNDLTGGQIADPSLLVDLGLADRYYRGARANAERAAILHNERINDSFAREVWAYLLRETEGANQTE